MALAVVRDLRTARPEPSAQDIADFETDALAGFVLARASAGLADSTIRNDVGHLEQVRTWFGRPLWEMQPPDADVYFGRILRDTAKGTRLARAQALSTYFLFLDLWLKVEIYNLTGHAVECPLDELNRPRGRVDRRTAARRVRRRRRGQQRPGHQAVDQSRKFSRTAASRRSAPVDWSGSRMFTHT